MNRAFAITGFTAFATAVLWVWAIVCLPWLPLYGSLQAAPSMWLLWACASAIGVALIFAFARYSLLAHWRALRRNTPLPPVAWRSVLGIYLMITLAFALPVFLGNPSHTPKSETGLYGGLMGLALLLAAIAFRRGLCRLA